MLMSDQAPAISPDVPRAIAQVLERSMVVDPDERFPTAAGMQRAVEAAMKELGVSASGEDIAAFLRSELPEPARRRREAVGKAIEEARERGTPITESRDEVAFAPTLVGERDQSARDREEDGAIALTKVKGGQPALRSAEVSHVAALEQEPLRIPKRSHAWLWAILLIACAGAGAALKWPAAAGGVLTNLGLRTSAPGPRSEKSSPPVAPTATSEPEVRPATSTPAAIPARAVPSVARTVVETASPRMPPVRAPAPASAVPSAPAMEGPDAAAPVGSSSAAPWPAPTESEDDPNNPYNN
jgi:hypothetical protein